MKASSVNTISHSPKLGTAVVTQNTVKKTIISERLSIIKQQIHNGDYVVDKEALAKAIIKFELGVEVND